MARTPMVFKLPDPPPNLELSPLANKTIDQAVDWLKDVLEINVRPRYLKTNTDSGELRCQIVSNRRMYSTAELYRFIATRPGHTAGKRNNLPDQPTGT